MLIFENHTQMNMMIELCTFLSDSNDMLCGGTHFPVIYGLGKFGLDYGGEGIFYMNSLLLTQLIIILNLLWGEFVETMSDVSICFYRSERRSKVSLK